MIDCPECVGFAKPVERDHDGQAVFRCELCEWRGRDPLYDIRVSIRDARREAQRQAPSSAISRWVFILDCLDTLTRVVMSKRGKR